MPVPPSLEQVKAYPGVADGSYGDDEITLELASEIVAQAAVCRIPADADPDQPQPYPADLAKALCRRVARALAMARKPLGYEAAVDGGLSYISAHDSEIKRLEARFRKVVIG